MSQMLSISNLTIKQLGCLGLYEARAAGSRDGKPNKKQRRQNQNAAGVTSKPRTAKLRSFC
jgi:hypothetical protein